MNEELLERLRALMGPVSADATRAPLGRPETQPTIGPVSLGTPPSPRPARGVLAAIARSAQAGGGLANEMLNPVRAGASARQMVNEAIPAARRGNVGRAVGLGALAAMSVPGRPRRVPIQQVLDDGGYIAQRSNFSVLYDKAGNEVKRVRPAELDRLMSSNAIVNRGMQIDRLGPDGYPVYSTLWGRPAK